jgi:hypothetical protein
MVLNHARRKVGAVPHCPVTAQEWDASACV